MSYADTIVSRALETSIAALRCDLARGQPCLVDPSASMQPFLAVAHPASRPQSAPFVQLQPSRPPRRAALQILTRLLLYP